MTRLAILLSCTLHARSSRTIVFGERADEIMALYHDLASKADLYLLDFHRQNIKFAPDESEPCNHA